MKIKDTKDIPEMLSILRSILNIKDAFTIWQRGEDNKIITQSIATLCKINEEEKQVSFELDFILKLDKKRPIFFAAKSSQIVFRLENIKQRENYLDCTLPDILKYKERRNHIRVKINRFDPKDVEVVFNVNNDSMENEEASAVTKLMDFSEGGVCIIVSKETLSQIDLTSVIKIKSLSTDINLSSKKGIIVNTRKYKGMTIGHEEMFAVGIMFI